MSGGAGLHADQARPQPREEPKNLSPTQLPAHHHPACRIDPMDLENALRQVQTDRANFLHGRLLSIRSSPTTSSWHVDAVAGAVHPISLNVAKGLKAVAERPALLYVLGAKHGSVNAAILLSYCPRE